MQVYTSSNTGFSGHINWNKSYKQTSDYAKGIGEYDVFKSILQTVKKLPERNLRIIHRYCKKDSLVKTQIFYNKYNYKDVYVFTSTKTKNPSEVTFQLLKNLLNPESELYRKIY